LSECGYRVVVEWMLLDWVSLVIWSGNTYNMLYTTKTGEASMGTRSGGPRPTPNWSLELGLDDAGTRMRRCEWTSADIGRGPFVPIDGRGRKKSLPVERLKRCVVEWMLLDWVSLAIWSGNMYIHTTKTEASMGTRSVWTSSPSGGASAAHQKIPVLPISVCCSDVDDMSRSYHSVVKGRTIIPCGWRRMDDGSGTTRTMAARALPIPSNRIYGDGTYRI
jgi:hypothetical protein